MKCTVQQWRWITLFSLSKFLKLCQETHFSEEGFVYSVFRLKLHNKNMSISLNPKIVTLTNMTLKNSKHSEEAMFSTTDFHVGFWVILMCYFTLNKLWLLQGTCWLAWPLWCSSSLFSMTFHNWTLGCSSWCVLMRLQEIQRRFDCRHLVLWGLNTLNS